MKAIAHSAGKESQKAKKDGFALKPLATAVRREFPYRAGENSEASGGLQRRGGLWKLCVSRCLESCVAVPCRNGGKVHCAHAASLPLTTRASFVNVVPEWQLSSQDAE